MKFIVKLFHIDYSVGQGIPQWFEHPENYPKTVLLYVPFCYFHNFVTDRR